MRIGGRADKGTGLSPEPLSVWSGSGLGESAVVAGEVGDSVLDRVVNGDVGSGTGALGAASVPGLVGSTAVVGEVGDSLPDRAVRALSEPVSVWSGSGLGESAVVAGEVGAGGLDRAAKGDVSAAAVLGAALVLRAALMPGLDDPVVASRGVRVVVSGRTVVSRNGSNHRASSAAQPPNRNAVGSSRRAVR